MKKALLLGALLASLAPVSHAATATFSYSGPPVAIPDGADLTGSAPGAQVGAPIVVTGFMNPVSKVSLSIDGTSCTANVGATTVGIDHSFVNDLRITLRAPNGTEVEVIHNTDGSGNNLCQVVLDDDSAGPSIQSVVSANAPFTGSYTPYASLAAFAGGSANGTWTLLAQDFYSQDLGNIRAWSITITDDSIPPVAVPTLSVFGMLGLGSLLGAAGLRRVRQRKAR